MLSMSISSCASSHNRNYCEILSWEMKISDCQDEECLSVCMLPIVHFSTLAQVSGAFFYIVRTYVKIDPLSYTRINKYYSYSCFVLPEDLFTSARNSASPGTAFINSSGS